MKYLKYIAAGAVAIFGIVLLVLTFGKSKVQIPDLKLAFRAIDAEAKAKKLVAELGQEKALAKVHEEYAEVLAQLDQEEEEEAKKLVSDVPRLARLLAGKEDA